MQLHLSDEQDALVDTTRKFLDRTMPPAEVRALAEDQRPLPPGYWAQAAELGWTSMLVPESLGGGSLTGRPLADLALVAEEIGAHVAPGPIGALNAAVSSLAGSEVPEHQELLRSVADGTSLLIWASEESGAAWDGVPKEVFSRKRGDDYVLSGAKVAVECALEADHFVVPALTDLGPSQFLVPADAAGLERERQSTVDPTRRFGRITLDDVRLPASAVVGVDGRASADIEQCLLTVLSLQCAETVGAMARAFDLVIDWVRDRYAFGRPIGSYQALKHRLADHKLWLEVALAASAGLVDAVADGDDQAQRLASATASTVADAALRIIQDSIQMFGGIGVTWDHDAHLYLRRATANAGLSGTTTQHRERLCALVADRKDAVA